MSQPQPAILEEPFLHEPSLPERIQQPNRSHSRNDLVKMQPTTFDPKGEQYESSNQIERILQQQVSSGQKTGSFD